MQVDPREALLDATHHIFIPLDFKIGVQSALHEHARAAQFHGLADLLVDGLKVQHVALDPSGAFYRRVEGAEGAVFGAEIRVVNIAVNDVCGHAFRMELAAERVGLHANADQIVGVEQVQGLLFGE